MNEYTGYHNTLHTKISSQVSCQAKRNIIALTNSFCCWTNRIYLGFQNKSKCFSVITALAERSLSQMQSYSFWHFRYFLITFNWRCSRFQGIEPCEVWHRNMFGLCDDILLQGVDFRERSIFIDRSIQSVHLWAWLLKEDSQSVLRCLTLQCPQGYCVIKLIAWQTYMDLRPRANSLFSIAVLCCPAILHVSSR